MRKKKIKKTGYSFFRMLFHKPLLILFLLVFLPFLLWAVQQSQQIISLGVSSGLHPQAQSFACPTTSTQTYGTLGLRGHEIENGGPADQNSDINISLRGYEEVNEVHTLIDYGGDTDPNMPPSLGTFFTRTPSIVKTYRVHQWDYAAHTRKPELETNWPVSVIGLATNPGEPLVGLKAGREIGSGYILMVIYATPTSITFNYSDDESGYPIYLDNLCVDPNLVSAYQTANAGGRGALPAIKTGQVFGYGNGSDLRIAIRDTGSWMDPRAKKDWWQGSDATSGTSTSPPPDTLIPTQTQTAISIPVPTSVPQTIPTVIPTSQPQPTSAINQPVSPRPTTQIIYITATPIPHPTFIPSPTPLPTSAPFIDVKKTVNNAKSIWSNIIVSILQFTKVILP